MNTAKTYQSIIKMVSSYSAQLAMLKEEDFQLSPPIGGWSYSEVYSHIFDSSLLTLMAIEKCINGEGENKPTTMVAKVVLLFGFLPKVKVPAKLADRVKKIDLQTAQQLITKFELQLATVYPQIAQGKSNVKVKHPKLGYLNAKQWLRFVEIHFNHHLKQLNRIKHSFKTAH